MAMTPVGWTSANFQEAAAVAAATRLERNRESWFLWSLLASTVLVAAALSCPFVFSIVDRFFFDFDDTAVDSVFAIKKMLLYRSRCWPSRAVLVDRQCVRALNDFDEAQPCGWFQRHFSRLPLYETAPSARAQSPSVAK